MACSLCSVDFKSRQSRKWLCPRADNKRQSKRLFYEEASIRQRAVPFYQRFQFVIVGWQKTLPWRHVLYLRRRIHQVCYYYNIHALKPSVFKSKSNVSWLLLDSRLLLSFAMDDNKILYCLRTFQLTNKPTYRPPWSFYSIMLHVEWCQRSWSYS